MPLSYKNYRRLWFILALLYFSFGYLVLNWINQSRSYYFDVSFSFESKIPFINYFIIGYLLVYFSVVGLYFLVTDEGIFKRMVEAFFFITTVHYIFFILFPVKMTLRPEIDINSTFDRLTAFYYNIDLPYNAFPSLHVAYTLLGAFVFLNYKRKWTYIYFTSALIVSISVIFVKQHYIADVGGAYATVIFTYLIIFKRKSRAEV